MIKSNHTIGFIGGGKMAEAIIAGITEGRKDLQVLVSDVDEKRTILLEESYGTKTIDSIDDLCKQTQVIIIAVKPQILHYVIESNRQAFTDKHLVVSVAAGISLEKLSEMLVSSRLVRVMPNSPALIGMGASAICAKNITEEDKRLVDDIFSSVGHNYWLEEAYFDAVTSLSGSGPAYVYMFIEALIDAGVNQGLPRQTARKLSLDTIIGSAKMVDKTGKHPGELKDMVTSPGGTTIRAVEVLEECGFRSALSKAISAATLRSKELGE